MSLSTSPSASPSPASREPSPSMHEVSMADHEPSSPGRSSSPPTHEPTLSVDVPSAPSRDPSPAPDDPLARDSTLSSDESTLTAPGSPSPSETTKTTSEKRKEKPKKQIRLKNTLGMQDFSPFVNRRKWFCLIPECKSNYILSLGVKLTAFKVPEENDSRYREVRQYWFHAMGYGNPEKIKHQIPRTGYVCELHFWEECISLNKFGRKVLQSGSYPCLNVVVPNYIQTPDPSKADSSDHQVKKTKVDLGRQSVYKELCNAFLPKPRKSPNYFELREDELAGQVEPHSYLNFCQRSKFKLSLPVPDEAKFPVMFLPTAVRAHFRDRMSRLLQTSSYQFTMQQIDLVLHDLLLMTVIESIKHGLPKAPEKVEKAGKVILPKRKLRNIRPMPASESNRLLNNLALNAASGNVILSKKSATSAPFTVPTMSGQSQPMVLVASQGAGRALIIRPKSGAPIPLMNPNTVGPPNVLSSWQQNLQTQSPLPRITRVFSQAPPVRPVLAPQGAYRRILPVIAGDHDYTKTVSFVNENNTVNFPDVEYLKSRVEILQRQLREAKEQTARAPFLVPLGAPAGTRPGQPLPQPPKVMPKGPCKNCEKMKEQTKKATLKKCAAERFLKKANDRIKRLEKELYDYRIEMNTLKRRDYARKFKRSLKLAKRRRRYAWITQQIELGILDRSHYYLANARRVLPCDIVVDEPEPPAAPVNTGAVRAGNAVKRTRKRKRLTSETETGTDDEDPDDPEPGPSSSSSAKKKKPKTDPMKRRVVLTSIIAEKKKEKEMAAKAAAVAAANSAKGQPKVKTKIKQEVVAESAVNAILAERYRPIAPKGGGNVTYASIAPKAMPPPSASETAATTTSLSPATTATTSSFSSATTTAASERTTRSMAKSPTKGSTSAGSSSKRPNSAKVTKASSGSTSISTSSSSSGSRKLIFQKLKIEPDEDLLFEDVLTYTTQEEESNPTASTSSAAMEYPVTVSDDGQVCWKIETVKDFTEF